MTSSYNNMNRKEFIASVGKGAAFALLFGCLGGCTKMEDPIIRKPNSVQLPEILKINLDDYPQLQTSGGYIIVEDSVVIAQNSAGEFIAATRACSDEGNKEIIWAPSIEEWYCTAHSATFSTDGTGTTTFNNLGVNGLQTYFVEQMGNTLCIHIV